MDTTRATAGGTHAAATDIDVNELSTPQLMSRLSHQTSELVSAEVRLAKAELQESIKHAGLGVGMFGAAGVLGLYAGGALVAAAVLGLAVVLPAWLAALAVGAALLLVVGILALTGKKQVQQAPPPLQESAASVQADVAAVKGARRG